MWRRDEVGPLGYPERCPLVLTPFTLYYVPILGAPLTLSSRIAIGPSFSSHEALNLGLAKPSPQALGTFLLR